MQSEQIVINLGAVIVSVGALTLGSLAYFIKRLIKDFDEIKKEMQQMHKDVAVLKAEVVKRNGFDAKIEKLRIEFREEVLSALKEGRSGRADLYSKIHEMNRELSIVKGERK